MYVVIGVGRCGGDLSLARGEYIQLLESSVAYLSSYMAVALSMGVFRRINPVHFGRMGIICLNYARTKLANRQTRWY